MSQDVVKQTKLISLVLQKSRKNISVEDDIKRNILNILNTRTTTKLKDFLTGDLKASDFRNYGLPELSSLNFKNNGDVRILCKLIEIAILKYELRITQFEVYFVKYDPLGKNIYLNMRAKYKENLSSINIVLKLGVWEFTIV